MHFDLARVFLVEFVVLGYYDISKTEFFRFGDALFYPLNGAHFTTCEPDYGRDEAFQKAYVDAARDADTWKAFVDRFLSGDESSYQRAVAEWRADKAKEATK